MSTSLSKVDPIRTRIGPEEMGGHDIERKANNKNIKKVLVCTLCGE